MKRFLLVAALAAFAAPSFAADVGVSVSVGQPGFYGQIDIGDFPQPRVIYAKPVVIERTVVVDGPVYLRVPPGHRKNWKKYCGRYDSCGREVYFVSNTWYTNEYAPKYRSKHGDHNDGHHGDDHGKGHGKGKGKGH